MNLSAFSNKNLFNASIEFFSQLDIKFKSPTAQAMNAEQVLGEYFKQKNPFTQIGEVYFLGLIDDKIFSNQGDMFSIQAETHKQVLDRVDDRYPGIMVFAISLNDGKLTRTDLSEITRAFNKASKRMPVIVLYKYQIDGENYITFTTTERREYKQQWREGEKITKVILLKEIRVSQPHTGHLKILLDLKKKPDVSTFEHLYKQWKEVFDIQLLNKNFYREIANWYFWANDVVEFPDDIDKEKNIRNPKNLIRLLTRLIFVWFLKEKHLVPNSLFEKSIADKVLNNKDKKGSTYYKAILQNLFFATLNTSMKRDDSKSRIFVDDAEKRGYINDGYLQPGYFRYKRFIKDIDLFIKEFEDIPFLNGGLFECLDTRIGDKEIRVDCFSDNKKNESRLAVPDELFFSEEADYDLNKVYDTKNKKYKVRGLINILNNYKFTVTENTPIEEEIALDPELLGRIFENLLASYNPETQTTARKATGSYYTPREIVNYMVDESLVAYLNSTMSIPAHERSTLSINAQESNLNISPESPDEFFNPNNEIEIYHGNLPHWRQENVWYFVTFRLADSIPSDVAEEIINERKLWLTKHDKSKLTKEEKIEYYKLFSERIENLLNSGKGSCVLKDEKVAAIVADALKHFNQQRYVLDEWIIMPNHVHVIVKPIGDNKLQDILHSWKSYTANEINKLLNKKGQFWLHESYDHIIRNEFALNAIRNYIRENPLKAGIKLPKVCYGFPVADTFGSRDALDTFGSRDALDTFGSRDASDTFGSIDASDTFSRLRELLSYSEVSADFTETEKEQLLDAIENVKILDPACGSGAFPMGMLHKLVHILNKIDPKNELWKRRIIDREYRMRYVRKQGNRWKTSLSIIYASWV